MAYVIIVEFPAKPDQIEAFGELIDRHAHSARKLEDGCPAFDVGQDPDDPGRFVFYEACRNEAAPRRHLEMGSYRWFGPRPRTFSCPDPRARCPTTARC
ncbi:MAG: putative quinol monooxygenase [Geminicoccaceae bacterium]